VKKRLNVILIITALIGLFLAITNPSEDSFYSRLQQDYGSAHSGFNLSKSQLLEMGNSQYASYFFFSKFSYQFGNIGVHYVGIGSFIIPLESQSEDLQEAEQLALR